MANLKRTIYGSPIFFGYRMWRQRQLAGRSRDHHLGFKFAGSESYFKKSWEVSERVVADQQFSRVDAFIDVGANHGVYSCWAASRGLQVAAIEPEQGNLIFLLENIRGNDQAIEVYPVAASDAASILTFYGDGDMASLLPGWAGTKKSFAQLVPSNTLDNLFADRWVGKPVFVKIDVEGHEHEVLKGASQFLRRTGYTSLMIETFPRFHGDETPINPHFSTVFEIMLAAGFAGQRVGTGEAITGADVGRWSKGEADYDMKKSNFLFVRD
jgi:FkbM family methyltransferase